MSDQQKSYTQQAKEGLSNAAETVKEKATDLKVLLPSSCVFIYRPSFIFQNAVIGEKSQEQKAADTTKEYSQRAADKVGEWRDKASDQMHRAGDKLEDKSRT